MRDADSAPSVSERSAARTAVKASACQSTAISPARGRADAGAATTSLTATTASQTPAHAASATSTDDSTTTCLTSRTGAAPRARRTASSLRRTISRVVIRLRALANPISNRNAEAPSSMKSRGRTLPTICSRSPTSIASDIAVWFPYSTFIARDTALKSRRAASIARERVGDHRGVLAAEPLLLRHEEPADLRPNAKYAEEVARDGRDAR